MAAAKPTIVLIPGAWHTPTHYSTLISLLEASSYPTASSSLPSINSTTPLSFTVSDDISFARNKLLLPLLDSGKDIILLSHSYGGLVGGAAAKGLSKSERAAEGKQGGVVGLIFVAAFIGKEGQDLRSMVGGNLDPRINIDETSGQMTLFDPVGMFYQDLTPSVAAVAVASLQSHAHAAFTTPLPAPAWEDNVFDGKRAYVKTSEDSGVPPFFQDIMLGGSGVEWEVKTMNTGHSPFLGKPEELRNVLVEVMERFGRKREE